MNNMLIDLLLKKLTLITDDGLYSDILAFFRDDDGVIESQIRIVNKKYIVEVDLKNQGNIAKYCSSFVRWMEYKSFSFYCKDELESNKFHFISGDGTETFYCILIFLNK